MSDKLETIFKMQADLQVEKMGGHPYDFLQPLKIQFIKDMILALEDELHEAMGEVGWKPWATSRHINHDAYRNELVDALHFFVNLCLVDGMDAQELFDRYVDKNAKNHKRQEDGYDGLNKCPGCKRALDDEAVKCYRSIEDITTGMGTPVKALTSIWCDELKRWYSVSMVEGG